MVFFFILGLGIFVGGLPEVALAQEEEILVYPIKGGSSGLHSPSETREVILFLEGPGARFIFDRGQGRRGEGIVYESEDYRAENLQVSRDYGIRCTLLVYTNALPQYGCGISIDSFIFRDEMPPQDFYRAENSALLFLSRTSGSTINIQIRGAGAEYLYYFIKTDNRVDNPNEPYDPYNGHDRYERFKLDIQMKGVTVHCDRMSSHTDERGYEYSCLFSFLNCDEVREDFSGIYCL